MAWFTCAVALGDGLHGLGLQRPTWAIWANLDGTRDGSHGSWACERRETWTLVVCSIAQTSEGPPISLSLAREKGTDLELIAHRRRQASIGAAGITRFQCQSKQQTRACLDISSPRSDAVGVIVLTITRGLTL